MNYDKNIWCNLGIEDCNYYELAKFIIPEDCEFPVRCIEGLPTLGTFPLQDNMRVFYTPRFHFITKSEEQDLMNGTWSENKSYMLGEIPYGLYFPNCSLRTAERELKELKDKAIDELLNQYYYEDNRLIFNKQTLYRAVFTILHEYGHYQTYKRLGSSKEAYFNFLFNDKMEYHRMCEIVKSNPNRTIDDKLELQRSYRELPDEKEADDYALEHLEETMERVIEYLRAKVLESND